MAELILALDVAKPQKAMRLAGELSGIVGWVKVGLELFSRGGAGLVLGLAEQGFKIFLDLKFYDIPNTVSRAVAAVGEWNVGMLTVHCQGGEKMCRAALEAAQKFAAPPLVFGVTALTSFGPGEMPGISAAPSDFAFSLAGKADQWGMDGVVCSGREVGAVKNAFPRLLALCPGIRPAGSSADDQKRSVTPATACREGADFLVVGRPILNAASPLEAALSIQAEIACQAQKSKH